MSVLTKYLFIDRDGTLIKEPDDKQIDSFDKFKLLNNVITSLISLKNQNYKFVMISNQDGLGSKSFPFEKFNGPQNLLIDILKAHEINFQDILICPHFENKNCHCRKPKLGLLNKFFIKNHMDLDRSFVIGDRESDIEFAKNIGIKGIKIDEKNNFGWIEIVDYIKNLNRKAQVFRKTKETQIDIKIFLDDNHHIDIDTGIGFFDHMLEILAKHSGIGIKMKVDGDLHIDSHHTLEDSAIAIGECLKIALGDKIGINRYGFCLPMDESTCSTVIDLSGRFYFSFNGKFPNNMIGTVPSDMIMHFFRSLAQSLKANLYISVKGQNTHHMIECIFKSFARSLKLAIKKDPNDYQIPSTKGVI